jgi:hypothetical protein
VTVCPALKPGVEDVYWYRVPPYGIDTGVISQGLETVSVPALTPGPVVPPLHE